jgi:hypothetical protein
MDLYLGVSIDTSRDFWCLLVLSKETNTCNAPAVEWHEFIGIYITVSVGYCAQTA